MNEQKIKKLLAEGKIIAYQDIFAKYSRKRQQEILEGVVELKLRRVIRNLLKVKGLTQQELANRLEVDKTYVDQLEQGNSDVPVSILYKIAQVTGTKFEFGFK